jgi:MoxR-like ATPase
VPGQENRAVVPRVNDLAGTPVERLRARVARQVRGKAEVVELALVCVLAGGHLLVEDVPGVGKTNLGTALARAVGGSFRRLQFTSDLLPSDILGVSLLDAQRGAFTFRPGPIFANVVLADEINRTTPRTQSALLEAMNEGQVSVDGVTMPLPDPFLVIATQNPHDFHGTFPLPEGQLDRFLVRAAMGYAGRDAEREVLRGAARAAATEPAAVSLEELGGLREQTAAARVHLDIEDYLLDLVQATRSSAALARGVSTRGAEALQRAARARAVLQGRDFVIPEDVRELAVPVLAHRVVPRGEPGGAPAAIRAALAEVRPPA